MAKLYFRYGTVGSAKTLNLLAVAHNYRLQGKKVVLIKPKLDDRFDEATIRSRAGLEKAADFVVEGEETIDRSLFLEVSCVLVDEAQFLKPAVIDQFRNLTNVMNVPIICYGLRTDFRTHLFPGAKRLMEVADSIEEIKTTCTFCNRKATTNLKHVDGKPTIDGPTIDLGCEEKYFPACYSCYRQQLDGI